MAFVITKNRRIKWPVTIGVPIDGGEVEHQKCTAEFEILDQDKYDALMENDVEFCHRVIVGFGDDIQGEDGLPLPYTEENKSMLIKSAAYIRMGFINAYHEAATGITAKNLKGRPSSGQTGRKSRKKR
jgi:hypothetical protein